MTYHDAADIFQANAREIMRCARRSGKQSYRVLAEVNDAGQWQGAGIVTAGTGSLLAYENRGYACYFDCSPFRSLADIHEQIAQWEEEMYSRAEAQGNVR